MRTRAITIRLAQNDESDVVRRLAEKAGFANDWLDWSAIYPHWLVAELDGRVLGAIQFCPGRPVARLEILSLEPTLSHYAKGQVVRRLLLAGMTSAREYGAQAVSGLVPYEMTSYRKIIERRGGAVADSGNLMLFRVGP
jgi:hypothetical protein